MKMDSIHGYGASWQDKEETMDEAMSPQMKKLSERYHSESAFPKRKEGL